MFGNSGTDNVKVEALVDLGLGVGESIEDATRDIERRYDVRVTPTGRYVAAGNPEVMIFGRKIDVRRVLDDVFDMTRQEGERFTQSLMRAV